MSIGVVGVYKYTTALNIYTFVPHWYKGGDAKMMFAMKEALDKTTKRKVANAIITGIILVVSGGATLFIGLIIFGVLDSHFTNLASQLNISSYYTDQLGNARTEVGAALSLIGITILVLGANIVISAVRGMGG